MYFTENSVADDQDSEIDRWQMKIITLFKVFNWVFLNCVIIMALTGFASLIFTVCKPELRTNWFLIAIAFFATLTGCFGILFTAYSIRNDY